jgi:hypothetical protein
MKLFSFVLAAALAVASIGIHAQSAPPAEGEVRANTSVSCSGNTCTVTTFVWVYVVTPTGGFWELLSSTTSTIPNPDKWVKER